jgi:hypothetical protein
MVPGVPSRESNLGLPYSKPTHYQLSSATLYELRRTLSATPHPESYGYAAPRSTIIVVAPNKSINNPLVTSCKGNSNSIAGTLTVVSNKLLFFRFEGK